MSSWDMRYANKGYLFGRDPSHFLTERSKYFAPGDVALMVADGEGRNGVYLAQRGLRVHSVDGSTVALRKAKKLADEAGVQMVLENADVTDWTWYENAYAHVVGIFIQFADPETRARLFENMKSAVKPGGYLMLHGYRPEQIALGTGGRLIPRTCTPRNCSGNRLATLRSLSCQKRIGMLMKGLLIVESRRSSTWLRGSRFNQD